MMRGSLRQAEENTLRGLCEAMKLSLRLDRIAQDAGKPYVAIYLQGHNRGALPPIGTFASIERATKFMRERRAAGLARAEAQRARHIERMQTHGEEQARRDAHWDKQA